MGPGPFVEALEYASGKEALVVGKPELGFFKSVLQEFDCLPEETVMIGDVRDSIIKFLEYLIINFLYNLYMESAKLRFGM